MHDEEHILVVGSEALLVIDVCCRPPFALDFIDKYFGHKKFLDFSAPLQQLVKVV